MNLRFRGSRTLSCLVQSGLSVIFLIFGIDLLLAAYALESPQYFILTFFASNLIILISAVVLLGGLLRWYRGEQEEEEEEAETAPSTEPFDKGDDATENRGNDERVS